VRNVREPARAGSRNHFRQFRDNPPTEKESTVHSSRSWPPLAALRFQPDGAEVVVGRVDVDAYGVFPADGAELLRRLAAGDDQDEVARWYERGHGESVDLDDLWDTLDGLGFLAPGADPPAPGRGRLERLGAALFSPPAWLAFAALGAFAVACWIAHPALRPHHDRLFFSPYLLVIELTGVLGQVPLLMLHECFHLLAARRLGVRARIRVSRRLYFVAFETVMDGLVLVPRRRRYLPLLAGMLADLLVVSALTVLARLTLGPDGHPSAAGAVALALAFATLLRFGMQFLLFLRTDLYHLVSTVCGCLDLHGTASAMVRNALWRRLGRPGRMTDPGGWHPNDVRVARWYIPCFLGGYTWAFTLLALVGIPVMWRFLTTAARALLSGDPASAHFWDAAGLLLLTTAEPMLAGLLALRERRSARRAAPRPERTPS
jgi:hypothetical protein